MNIPTTTADHSRTEQQGHSIIQAFRAAVMWIAGRIARFRRTRVTYMALRDLDDHLLRDIGLSRADVVDLETFGRRTD